MILTTLKNAALSIVRRLGFADTAANDPTKIRVPEIEAAEERRRKGTAFSRTKAYPRGGDQGRPSGKRCAFCGTGGHARGSLDRHDRRRHVA